MAPAASSATRVSQPCRLAPDGFQEISRAKLLDPTTNQLNQRGGVCWSHPAFANHHVYARNDKELVCADLAARQ